MAQSTQVTTIEHNQRASLIVTDPVHVLDTGRFEQMQRVAVVMAECSTIPDSFRFVDGKPANGELAPKTVIANCFRVINQAVRWGFDPFAVMDCASIIHGKLMWEGKLIHAVLQAKLGVNLDYAFNDRTDQSMAVTVSGTLPGDTKVRTITGTVAQWHKGSKSPWANAADWPRQLRYRGAREWARAHAPSVVLGVYGDDEFDPDEPIARVVHDITPRKSSAQAKRDGDDGPFNEIRARIAQATTEEELAAVMAEFASVIETLPPRWDELVKDDHAVRLEDISRGNSVNVAEIMAEMKTALDEAAVEHRQEVWDGYANQIDLLPDADRRQLERYFQELPAPVTDTMADAKADRLIETMERAPNLTRLNEIAKGVSADWPQPVLTRCRQAYAANKNRLKPIAQNTGANGTA